MRRTLFAAQNLNVRFGSKLTLFRNLPCLPPKYNICMDDYSMRNIFAVLLIFAGCGGWVSVATAQDVRLNVDWSQQRWNGFPDSVGKATSEWKDRALHVHVIVLWNTSMVI